MANTQKDSESTRAAKSAAAKAAATARRRARKVKALVDQIVASFINPVVGLILPGQGDLTKKTFHLTVGEKTAVFTYGNFLNVLISFMAVAAVIYFVVKGLKLDKIDKKKE